MNLKVYFSNIFKLDTNDNFLNSKHIVIISFTLEAVLKYIFNKSNIQPDMVR